MGNTLKQYRVSIGGFHSRICSGNILSIFYNNFINVNYYILGGWGNSSSSKSRAAHSSQVLFILQILSISLIHLEVSLLLRKITDPITKFVRVFVKAITYLAPAWLIVMSILLSLNVESEGQFDYKQHHGKTTLISDQ